MWKCKSARGSTKKPVRAFRLNVLSGFMAQDILTYIDFARFRQVVNVGSIFCLQIYYM